jgi:hypothetical protein
VDGGVVDVVVSVIQPRFVGFFPNARGNDVSAKVAAGGRRDSAHKVLLRLSRICHPEEAPR